MLGAVASCGPTLAAIAVVLMMRQSLRSLRATAPTRRLAYGTIGLRMPAAFHLSGSVVLVAFGGSTDLLQVYPPIEPEQIAIFVVAPLGEELGWRSCLQRRLQWSMPALRASLIVGVLWGVWHIPLLVIQGDAWGPSLGGLVYLAAAAIPFAYLLPKSGGSALVAMAAHAGAHLDNVNRAGDASIYATAGAAVVVAALIVWRDPSIGLGASTRPPP